MGLISARDELPEELNERMDKQLQEARDKGRPMAFLVVGKGGEVDHTTDFRESAFGLVQPVVTVSTPRGLDLFCVPQKPEQRGPSGFTTQIKDGGVLMIAIPGQERPLRTYSPTGWWSYDTK